MILEKTVLIDGEHDDYTGYTVSIPSSGVTGIGDIFIVQGTRIKSGRMVSEEVFPDSREEKFFDEKLVEFYKKKGYPIDKTK